MKNNFNLEKKEEESLGTNIATFSHQFWNTFSLMMRSHFSGSSFYLANVIIPIIITLSLGIVFPLYWDFSYFMYLSTLFAAFAAYGTLFFQIKKSTMIKNIELTATETTSLYFATFFVVLFVTFIAMAVVFVTIFIFDGIGILRHVWTASDVSFVDTINPLRRKIDWSEIWWSMVIYYWVMSTLVTFSMSFFFEQLVSTQTRYYILVFIYMTWTMFNGGTIGSTLFYDVDEQQLVYITRENFDTYWNGDLVYVIGNAVPFMTLEPMWYLQQLTPHYGLNQFAFNTFNAGSYYIDSDGVQQWTIWHDLNMFDLAHWHVLYYVLFPPVWSFTFFFVGGMIERYSKF